MNQRIQHAAQPGPDYWAWRCLICGEPCENHINPFVAVWRELWRLMRGSK